MATESTFKVNDRVKRVSGEGSYGTVVELRYEATNRDQESQQKSVMLAVRWDTGVVSVHGPAGLTRCA